MTTQYVQLESGLTPVYAYPADPRVSFASWTTYRKAVTEAASPNQGRYSFDDGGEPFTVYRFFVGAAQPASWDDALPDVLTIDRPFKQQVHEILKVNLDWDPESLVNGAYVFDFSPGYVFTDALGKVEAKIGDTVGSVRCRSTGLLVVATGAVTYKRGRFGSYYLDIASNGYLSMTGHSISNTNFFLSVAFEKATIGLTVMIGTQSTFAGPTYWYLGASSPCQFAGQTAGGSFGGTVLGDSWGAKENVFSGWFNNTTSEVSSSFTSASSAVTGSTVSINEALFWCRNGDGFYSTGKLCGVVIARGATTADERRRVILWNSQQVDYPVIACIGNSLTAGVGAFTPYPTQLTTLLQTEYGSNLRLHNFGVGGIVDEATYTAYPTTLSAIGGVGPNVAVIWGITNSLASGSYTAREAVDWLWQYCDLAKRQGWYVIVLDCIARDEAGQIATFQALRAQANQLIREEFTKHTDYLLPISTLPALSNPSDGLNFHSDLIHLTTAGNTVVANEVILAVRSALDRYKRTKRADKEVSILAIEASAILAKEATVSARPVLATIEGSTVLAKEATVSARPTLVTIEGSTILAKEATSNAIGSAVVALGTAVDDLPTLPEIEGSAVLAKKDALNAILGSL